MSSLNYSLIFGVTGQDGSLMASSLLKSSKGVIGVSRSTVPNLNNLNSLKISDDIKIVSCDLANLESTINLINRFKPHEIYNLSAQSSVGLSFSKPVETYKSIINGTTNLLEACRILQYEGNIFFAGSSEIFGDTSIPANVNSKIKAHSPYGIAKQISFELVKFYRTIYSLNCKTGILFNHESPLRSDNFITQKIIRSALKARKNKTYKINIGNIDIFRDWGWAEEYISAMQLINNSPKLNDHVICTGVSTSLENFISKVFSKLDLIWQDHIVIDKKLFRPNDIKYSLGDIDPLYKELKWKAKVTLDQIIDNLIVAKSKII